MRITRLGEGVDRTGRLGEEAIRRTVDVLAEFRKAIDLHGVVKKRAAATSAVRDAENAEEFLDRVVEVLGVVPEVLPGAEEGRLAYLGATAELDPRQGPYLLIDVGGGSTELVGTVGSGIVVVSLEVGCVRATERFFAHDPPLAGELEAARSYVRGLVSRAVDDHPGLKGAARLIGVAGTVAALSRLDQGLVAYDRDRIHHSQVTLAAVERLIGQLGSMTLESRLQWPALEAERADVIVGGAVVLAEAMTTLGFDTLTASESDLLDGIAAELLAA
jgi:exopolyphosphatase/guanosine-5'-triphosphate,3'-diphosphate pyrophosphatase